MRDRIGNKIFDGSLLFWLPSADSLKGLVVRCARVSDGGLSLGDSNQTTPPMLTVTLTVVVNIAPGAAEPGVDEFLCIVNPQAEAAIDKMLGEQRRQ